METLSNQPLDIIGYLLTFLSIRTVEGTLALLNKQWKYYVDNPKVCNMRKIINLDINMISNVRSLSSYRIVELNNRITDKVIIKLVNKYQRLHTLSLEMSVYDTYLCGHSLTTILLKDYKTKDIFKIHSIPVRTKHNNITDLSVIEISKVCKELVVLNLTNSNVTEEGLMSLYNNCTYLIYLNLNRCRWLNNLDIFSIWKKFKHISINRSNITKEVLEKRYAENIEKYKDFTLEDVYEKIDLSDGYI